MNEVGTLLTGDAAAWTWFVLGLGVGGALAGWLSARLVGRRNGTSLREPQPSTESTDATEQTHSTRGAPSPAAEVGWLDPVLGDLANIGQWHHDFASDTWRTSQSFSGVVGHAAEHRSAPPTLLAHLAETDAKVLSERWAARPLEAGEALVRLRHRVEPPPASSPVTVHVTWKPVLAEDERLLGRVGLIRTVTSSENADSALGNLQDTFYRTDADGCISFISSAITPIMGYTPEELVGAPLTNYYVDPAERERFFELMAAGHGHVSDYEAKFWAKDGSAHWLSTSAKYIYGERGEFAGVEGTTRDVTERKEAEEALVQFEALLQNGIDAMPVGFAIFDEHEALLYWNDEYAAALPSGGDEVEVGAKFEDLIRPTAQEIGLQLGYDSGQAYLDDRVAAFRTATRTSSRSWLFRQSTGAWRHTWDRKTATGQTISVRANVTEQKEMEAQLAQAQRMEAIGQLTGGIAHDFNNLLTVIQGNAAMVLGGNTEPQPRARAIIDAANRASELTERLLSFSRRQSLNPQSLDMVELVSETSNLLSRILGETIAVDFAFGPNLWPAIADRAQVENVLLNLAVNARHAMPDGGDLMIACHNVSLTEDTRAGEEITPGDYICLSVSDTGVGMNDTTKAHAFEPFFTTKDVGEGSGLGLSMVYGFAKQSGGHVELDSAPEKGTTISLYLPRDHVSAENEATKTPADRGNAVAAGKSVLLVEDDPGVRALICTMLDILEYEVTDVEDVAHAREVLDTDGPVDLILSDVVLPGGVSGADFAAELREASPDITLVLMSGYSPEHARPRGASEREVEPVLLRKPFAIEELADVLQNALA